MVENHYRWDFIGLSTDTKPTPETSEKVTDGSTFYCGDTSQLYVWCADDWYEKVVEGGGGGGGDEWKELTTADYNYPTNNPNSIAVWLLADGKYRAASGVRVAPKSGTNYTTGQTHITVDNLNGTRLALVRNDSFIPEGEIFVLYSNGAAYDGTPIELHLVNNLTSTYTTRPLTAYQGKLLNDKITSIQTTLATYEGRLQELENGGTVVNPSGDDNGEEPIVVDDGSGDEPMPVPEP